jgi:hypothetical protein
MKGTIEFEEIEEKTPFTTALRGRVIPTGFIYDPDHDNPNLPDFTRDLDWLSFVPDGDGNLVFMDAEPVTGIYFGAEPYEENDLNLQFFDLYYQRLSWPDIAGLFPQLVDDVRNMATCMTKFALFQSSFEETSVGIQKLVQTELEYLFFVSRSLYDNLQFIIANTWDKIVPADEESDFSADLPTNSFKSMALDGDEPVTTDELQDRYGIPEGLASFYSNEAVFFQKVRSFRDAIAHQGDSPNNVFISKEGLSVDITSSPYNEFDVWEEEMINKDDLAPLWPFVSHIVDHTLSVLDGYISGLLDKPLHLPYELAEDYDVYIRGRHTPNFEYLDSLKESDPWGDEFIDERLQR